MLFYASKNNNRLNGLAWSPELITGHVMVNPNYTVRLDVAADTCCDSGAFQHIVPKAKKLKSGEVVLVSQRLTPAEALARQLRLEAHIRQGLGLPDWGFSGTVIYDQMLGVDEAVVDGKLVKRRGTEETARPAIAETLASAAYYATQRARIWGAICFVAQGATPQQYVQECVLPMLDLMQPGDWFGFGGFCIIGKVPSLKPLFVSTVRQVLPLLRKKGIRRAHVLGVGVTDMVRFADEEGRKQGVVMSTDTSSIEVNSIMGRVFADGKWTRGYTREQKYVDYHPNLLASENIQRYDDWVSELGEEVCDAA